MLQWPGPCDPLELGSWAHKLASGWPGYLCYWPYIDNILCLTRIFFQSNHQDTHTVRPTYIYTDECLPPINDGIKSLDVIWMMDVRSVWSLGGARVSWPGWGLTHQAGAVSQSQSFPIYWDHYLRVTHILRSHGWVLTPLIRVILELNLVKVKSKNPK